MNETHKRSLASVATADLLEAQKRLARPTAAGLTLTTGLPDLASALADFGDVSREALGVAIDVALAERERTAGPAEVVWAGPEPGATTSRDTAAVVAAMIKEARSEVLISSFSLDTAHGGQHPIFGPLHKVMLEFGVRASIFIDLERTAVRANAALEQAGSVEVFQRAFWPFGAPLPEVYFDARALEPGPPCGMHARTLVVDRRWVLVGSANLTDRGMTRNIELGVKLDDAPLADRIVTRWMSAVRAGHFRQAAG